MEQRDTNQQRKKAFRDWFVRRWAEWDASTGRRSTQQELADYLGVGRPIVSHYLGHGSVAVTMRYLALTPDDTREMLNRFSPVEQLQRKK